MESPPGCSSSSRCTLAPSWLVSSASRLAARLVGATSTTLALLVAASVTMALTVDLLSAARAAGEHRNLAGQRQLDRLLVPGAKFSLAWLRSQPSALGQSTPVNAGSRVGQRRDRQDRFGRCDCVGSGRRGSGDPALSRLCPPGTIPAGRHTVPAAPDRVAQRADRAWPARADQGLLLLVFRPLGSVPESRVRSS